MPTSRLLCIALAILVGASLLLACGSERRRRTDGGGLDGGSPPTDAGVVEDGGPAEDGSVALDAGADSGSLDAGHDAGTDSGPIDGGPVDAGHDGGARDSGTLAPGDLIITEMMVNPIEMEDRLSEWVELYNPSFSDTFDLFGCVLTDTPDGRHPIATTVLVPPRAHIVLARSATPAGFTPTYVYGHDLALSNTRDSVALICPGDIEIDRVAYVGAPFDIAGRSASLNPSAYDAAANDVEANWCASTTILHTSAAGPEHGTPFETNPVCP